MLGEYEEKNLKYKEKVKDFCHPDCSCAKCQPDNENDPDIMFIKRRGKSD